MGIVQYFPDEPIVGDSIGWYGEYLRAQTDLLASLIKPGSVVMEVGAGIGAHVLALAPAIGGAGQFFVYESRPLFQQALRQNLGANGIGNVTVMKRALRGQEIPVQTRMMTIADIFDALTASDRPYKRAVPVDRALDILHVEAKEGMLDGALLQAFVEAKVYETLNK